MKTFINILITICVVIILALVLNVGIQKNDRVTCTNLKAQAEQYPLWYATQSERNMCHALGMDLPADNAPAPTDFDPIINHSEIK